MPFVLNIREVIFALSEALDYVGIDDTMHGKRVAYMAAEIAKKIVWEKKDIDDILAIGMLHDCGVSSTDVHTALVNELDWENSYLHCERGYELLKKVTFFTPYASPILYHHTHWNEFPNNTEIKLRLFANIIYLVDRVDALRVQLGYTTNIQKNAIRTTIQKYSGTMFAPHLVDAFLDISISDSFWYYMESSILHDYFLSWIDEGQSHEVAFGKLKEIAEMFADIVDAKSTFTYEHTSGVASLATYLAKMYGLSVKQQEIIELAGYFHDLGKLKISDALLLKPGPLSDEERSCMNHHGFDSQIILRKVKGFEEVSKIASMHHETLDSKGYPFHYQAEQIPIEARVLTIADIFQALIQDRPYRVGLTIYEAYEIMEYMREEGKIDGTILAILHDNLEICHAYAMPISSRCNFTSS